MDKMNHAFEKMKMMVGMEVEEEQRASGEEEESSLSFMDDINQDCALTTKQRFYGFAICLSAGLTCTLLSMLVFFNPVKFGITFTLGNLMALGSTAFLIGPQRQVTMMLDPARIYATALYLASIIIALFCALYVRNKLLTLLAIILEFSGLIWYSLSYIPFARTMVSKAFMTCFDTEF
ncbi:Vesicle transport protein [Hirschfeldia incana]|nr:Vesicle transport protein [Hirschfeldia incana]